jgi:nucleotide-binding universal stress UspA family protein
VLPPARILAAVDFSEPSRTALHFASRLARQSHAELHVVHIADPGLSAVARSAELSLREDLTKELRRFAAEAPLPEERTRYHTICGSPGSAIQALAHRESCDLLVVGTHGSCGDNPYPFGSTTEELLRDSDLPVLVVPGSWLAAHPATQDLSGTGPFIVGLEFTCPSTDAAMAAAQLAARVGTRVLLVHVVTPPTAPSRWRTDIDAIVTKQVDEARDRAEPVLAAVRRIVPVTFEVLVGAVASCLISVALSAPCGVLVLGRAPRPRSYGPPGAVASRVLARTRIPVLMHIPATS